MHAPSMKIKDLFSGRLSASFTFVAGMTVASSALATPGVPSNGQISFGAFYTQTDGHSWTDSISDDARFVTYHSTASNIVAEDPGWMQDLYLYDRFWGFTTLISVRLRGAPADDEGAVFPVGKTRSISSDGRYVMFTSGCPNIVNGDTNNAWDVFLRDTQAGTTTRAVTRENGTPINEGTTGYAMTRDARKILFGTTAGLAASDTNGAFDIYVYDRSTRRSSLASRRTNGTPLSANPGNYLPAIDGTGTYVVLQTSVSLVAADTNTTLDLYRIQVSNGAPYLITSNSSGVVANGSNDYTGSISADGTRVAFSSKASNLVNGDTNGEWDAFVKIIATGQTVRTSQTASGAQGQSGGRCFGSVLNGNGRYAVLTCSANYLLPGNPGGSGDNLIKDLTNGAVTRLNKTQAGAVSPNAGEYPAITYDGSWVVFGLLDSVLFSPDTNGKGDVVVSSRQ
jgi:hypothetical protein